MPLTAIDRLEIIELPARYADTLDRLEPEELRGVFTDDAVWEVVEVCAWWGSTRSWSSWGGPTSTPALT